MRPPPPVAAGAIAGIISAVSVSAFVYNSRPLNSTAALRQRTQHLPVRLWAGSRLQVILLFATLGLLWFILFRDLSLEWSSNEQYSYGWFVPFFAAFLFWLR